MIFDCIIIGGGPAGLSAAIYLGRFQRKVLVIDSGKGRSTYPQINENYLGFPKGISARQLRSRGKVQAKKFGTRFLHGKVTTISQNTNLFTIQLFHKRLESQAIIFATGVTDIFPEFPGRESYIGKSLFWCITCDGYKTRGKKVMVVGNNDEAACTCMQFLNYTDSLTFVTNTDGSRMSLSKKWSDCLIRSKIKIIKSKIKKVEGSNGIMKSVTLESGENIPVDFMFNQQGANPNSALAKKLALQTDEDGYIIVDEEQRTNIPHIYAAGDVTRLFSHQIVTAAHEGSMAAQAVNYDLYHKNQRTD